MIAPIQKGQTIELEIDNLAFGGKGIARLEGMVVFVDKALPGDRVKACITKRKPQYAEADIVEIIVPSPQRREPDCPLFGLCGGCTWQNFNYTEQLRYKQQHVEEALRHIGKQQTFEVRPILASPDVLHYRNKMEYSFGHGPEGTIDLGLHHAGDFRRIVDVDMCLIQPDIFTEAVAWMRREINQLATTNAWIQPLDRETHEGFLRHFVMRHSYATGEFLASLITAERKWKEAEDLARRFMEAFPQCRGFMWGTNMSLNDVARVDHVRFQLGPGYIEDVLGQKRFRISTFSFFQTNTRAAKLLYDVIQDFAELSGKENVLDAYCGTGSIGIYISDFAKHVVGIELIREAIWDARHNAELNGAKNCTFFAGEMRDVLTKLPGMMNLRFDRLVVDPPRGGMDKKSLRLLLSLEAPVIVYVSCNPATLARDSVTICEAGYRVETVQPVDMFPHTYHVESVLRFRRDSTMLASRND